MATSEWIAAAARVDKPTTGSGFDSSFQHVLAMARADEEREALDRVMAARTVQRVGHENAGELLAMLGLERPAPAALGRAGWKTCRDCGQELPLAQFPLRKTRRDGRDSYCKACHRKRAAARKSDVKGIAS